MKLVVCALLLSFAAGCRGEWDVPKTARRDPCTGLKEDKHVYVMPTCMRPPAQGPQR